MGCHVTGQPRMAGTGPVFPCHFDDDLISFSIRMSTVACAKNLGTKGVANDPEEGAKGELFVSGSRELMSKRNEFGFCHFSHKHSSTRIVKNRDLASSAFAN